MLRETGEAHGILGKSILIQFQKGLATTVICNNILEAMGNTPLIRLGRMAEPGSAQILVKFEGLNVGGSIKTRTACNMIRDAEEKGLIREDTIIVEPTSGNQGIGLALVGAVRGYHTRIIMPDSVSEERRKLMKHYGAEVVLVHDAGNIGECIEECLNTALKMAEEDPRVFVPQQFENPANPAVHRSQTAIEILEQADCPIDGFCSGIGDRRHHHRHRRGAQREESPHGDLGGGAGACGHPLGRIHRHPSSDGHRRRPDPGHPEHRDLR